MRTTRAIWRWRCGQYAGRDEEGIMLAYEAEIVLALALRGFGNTGLRDINAPICGIAYAPATPGLDNSTRAEGR